MKERKKRLTTVVCVDCAEQLPGGSFTLVLNDWREVKMEESKGRETKRFVPQAVRKEKSGEQNRTITAHIIHCAYYNFA